MSKITKERVDKRIELYRIEINRLDRIDNDIVNLTAGNNAKEVYEAEHVIRDIIKAQKAAVYADIEKLKAKVAKLF